MVSTVSTAERIHFRRSPGDEPLSGLEEGARVDAIVEGSGMVRPTFRSFAEQALHYFDRPHEGVCRRAIESEAAWRGAELVGDDSWVVRLGDGEIAELDAALAHAKSCGRDLAKIGRDDFPLPGLSEQIAAWARELRDGRGFLLLRGMPVRRWGDDGAALVFWGLGQHLGAPGAQNPDEEILGHVTDMGEERDNPYVRRYRTAGDIAYHCDLADVVGLLCLRPALRGGASRIVSSVSVYNRLLEQRPDLIDRLYEPFFLDTRNDSGTPFLPVVPCRYAAGVLRTFYHSDYFRSAPRHAEVPEFTVAERELLDLYEQIAGDPDLYLDMNFAAGDVQFISNHFTLHARTAYEDDPDPARQRHLLRLWLSLEH